MSAEGSYMDRELLKRKAELGARARQREEPASWATKRALQDPRLRREILAARRKTIERAREDD